MDSAYLAQKEIDITDIEDTLLNKVLIPDQSIFFKGKVSASLPANPGINIDTNANEVVIKGSEKFVSAAKEMIEAVYYIRNNITKLSLTADYITADMIGIMHKLSTEKHRTTILTS